jgi:hypothetical protein
LTSFDGISISVASIEEDSILLGKPVEEPLCFGPHLFVIPADLLQRRIRAMIYLRIVSAIDRGPLDPERYRVERMHEDLEQGRIGGTSVPSDFLLR